METVLVAIVDDLWLNLGESASMFCFISHGTPFGHLWGLPCCGSFHNEELQMVLRGRKSSPWTIQCEVLQGLVILPILFIIYMKPLREVIHPIMAKYHQYADDTQLYSFTPGQIAMELFTSWSYKGVNRWIWIQQNRINAGKGTFWMVHLLLQIWLNIPYNLGVLMDSHLLLQQHMKSMARRTWILWISQLHFLLE